MTGKIWLGGIYLKDEGGYEIILKSLNHYKNRLKTLDESPELKESSVHVGVRLHRSQEQHLPKINEVIEEMKLSGFVDSVIKRNVQ